jgi:DinB superfamily
MTQTDTLTAELRAGLDAINQEIAEIPEARWSTVKTSSEDWSVGHAAHHIAEGYLVSLGWIITATTTGHQVTLDPPVSLPAMNGTNARCLERHGGESRDETLQRLRGNAEQLLEYAELLSDEQLEAPMMTVMGEPRKGRDMVSLSLRHANGHLANIRAALTTPPQ